MSEWVKSLSRVWLFATPWTVVYQAPLSMGFSRQEYWNLLPFPSPGDLPDPGIKPRSPSLQADSLPSERPGKPIGQLTNNFNTICNFNSPLLGQTTYWQVLRIRIYTFLKRDRSLFCLESGANPGLPIAILPNTWRKPTERTDTHKEDKLTKRWEKQRLPCWRPWIRPFLRLARLR